MLGGKFFSSLDEVGGYIKRLLKTMQISTPWNDDVLADLALTRHYAISRLGIRPTRFMKRPTQRQWMVWELCADLPRLGWKTFSYKKCLQPWTFEHEFKKALRLRYAGRPHFSSSCKDCSSKTDLHVHHVSPTFEEISTSSFALVTDAERLDWLGYRWERDEKFVLPEEHSAVRLADKLEGEAEKRVLCERCHIETHRRTERS